MFEPLTDTIKISSEYLTKNMMLTSKENNKALENLNDKHLQKMNHRGILTSFLLSFLAEISSPELTSQFKLVKDLSPNKVEDLLICKTIPVTLYNNLLTFRDTDKRFELEGDFLKMITMKNYNVDLANLEVKKLLYDFVKEMILDEKVLGKKSNRDKSLIRFLKSPAIMASGFSTMFSPENPIKLCDRLKILLQEQRVGENSDLIVEEVVAIAVKLIEYKCISFKQHKFLLLKCLI